MIQYTFSAPTIAAALYKNFFFFNFLKGVKKKYVFLGAFFWKNFFFFFFFFFTWERERLKLL